MKVVVKYPGRAGEVRDVSPAEFRGVIGGPLQAIPHSPGVVAVCDEEGLLRGLAPNLRLPAVDHVAVGPVVLVGVGRSRWRGLTDRQIETLLGEVK